MKGAFWAALAGAALSVGSSPAFAAPEPAIASGNELLAACRDDGWQNGYCYGFVLGVYRGISVMDIVNKKQTFCTTDQVTVEQVVLIVQQYLVRNPKMMSETAELGVALALMDAFPCSKT